MRKEYIVYVDRYDYFDSFYDHLYHESCYETLGSNPIEALKAYRKLFGKSECCIIRKVRLPVIKASVLNHYVAA